MLDFAHVSIPRGEGEFVAEPPLSEWVTLLDRSRALLRGAGVRILDTDLKEVRSRSRPRDVGADRPLIATGHQPEFIHAGIWCKHVAAAELARRSGGSAVNLLVDHDLSKGADLRIPVSEDEAWRTRRIRLTAASGAELFEHLPRVPAERLAAFELEVRDAMGARCNSSAMPIFLSALGSDGTAADFVDQVSAARISVDRALEVPIVDARASQAPWLIFAADFICRAEPFAAAYNRALAEYRRRRRVLSDRRPMPDLVRRGASQEAPMWLVRPGASRKRCFVERRLDSVILYAEDERVAQLRRAALSSASNWARELTLDGGWSLRPRALMLTLWARLGWADFFVHGLGGARYDEITDDLIRHYYRCEPPPYACITATMRFAAGMTRAPMQFDPREARYNPQRLMQPTGVEALLKLREAIIEQSDSLRTTTPTDRAARRRLFTRMRDVNAQILARHPDPAVRAAAVEDGFTPARQAERIRADRTCFYALLAMQRLTTLAGRIREAFD